MPTGYTAALYDGKPQTFEDFVLDCARAFAWWHRDSAAQSLQAPPEQTYAQKALKEHKQKLRGLEDMRVEEYTWEHQLESERIRKANAERSRKNALLKARYEAMRLQVEAWEPPTETHQGLKDFMLEQLDSSIQHDTGEWHQSIVSSPSTWHRERIEHTRKMIARYEEDAEKEKERNEQNAQWVTALMESLGKEEAA